jgi:protein phosphatase
MEITVIDSAGFTECGKRTYNEDCIFMPEQQGGAGSVYMVCDGVGGAEKGEVASKMACDGISWFFSSRTHIPAGSQLATEALQHVHDQFQEYVAAHPASGNMATTIALLRLNPDSVTLVHLGDSRIYHIRNGKVIYQTKDHSLVNTLIDSGQLTPEEAIDHPRKNVITKAMQAANNSYLNAGIYSAGALETDDCFLLCSDGVVQSFPTVQHIENVFSTGNMANIAEAIKLQCTITSTDNYSACLLRISCTG